MKRFGYQNPYAPKKKSPLPKLGCALVVLMFAIAGLSRVNAPWNPLSPPRIREKLPPFLARLLPPVDEKQTAIATRKPSLVPRFDTNPSSTKPSLVPRFDKNPSSTKPSLVPQFEKNPSSTKPRVAVLPRSSTKSNRSDAFRFEASESNLPLKVPGRPIVFERRDAKISQLEADIERFPAFATYRALAARHQQLGNNAAAARTMRIQSRLFERKGLSDAAQVLSNRAARLETVVRAFVPAPIPNRKLAPLEPKSGAYLGAFIDRDDALTTRSQGDNWQYHHLPSEFETVTGRRHASVFTYVAWGNFPRQWLQMCKREGVIPHIAWEPQSLGEVRNDAYLQSCATFLRELDWPVFVRFAGEMNGDWVPYHGNPALYRQKFRLVHQALQSAPRVATIWCVNAIPVDNIESYYPGEDACDWVGVNLYSTPFADNDRTRAAFQDSPLTLLEPIYRKFANRKPIAICEYAASHQSAVDNVSRVGFAREKMALLYGSLPLLFPRVKLIDWYSSDNLRHAREGRRLNNYRLTQHSSLLQTYRDLTNSPHFLKSPDLPLGGESWREVDEVSGRELALWVSSTTARPAVIVKSGERVVYAARRTGAHYLKLKANEPLTVLVFDEKNRCVMVRRLN